MPCRYLCTRLLIDRLRYLLQKARITHSITRSSNNPHPYPKNNQKAATGNSAAAFLCGLIVSLPYDSVILITYYEIS